MLSSQPYLLPHPLSYDSQACAACPSSSSVHLRRNSVLGISSSRAAGSGAAEHIVGLSCVWGFVIVSGFYCYFGPDLGVRFIGQTTLSHTHTHTHSLSHSHIITEHKDLICSIFYYLLVDYSIFLCSHCIALHCVAVY